MYYMIMSTDIPDSLEKRLSVRPAHLARLQALADEGRLLLAGPNPIAVDEQDQTQGFSGSLVVAQFSSLEEAKKWAQEDPYEGVGVYSHVVVKPFKKVLP